MLIPYGIILWKSTMFLYYFIISQCNKLPLPFNGGSQGQPGRRSFRETVDISVIVWLPAILTKAVQQDSFFRAWTSSCVGFVPGLLGAWTIVVVNEILPLAAEPIRFSAQQHRIFFILVLSKATLYPARHCMELWRVGRGPSSGAETAASQCRFAPF